MSNSNISFQPFDLLAGKIYTLAVKGIDDKKYYNGSTVKFVRGRKVFFQGKLKRVNDILVLDVKIPIGILNGLFKAVININKKTKIVIPNAIRTMQTDNHNGVLIPVYEKWFYLVDEEGIPMKDVGGDIGYVRHPLVATYYALHYLLGNPESISEATRDRYFWNILDWFKSEIEEGPENSVLIRHRFPLESYHLAPGWVSGLTQGRFAELCARVYLKTKDDYWRDLAVRSCHIMWVPVEKGGLLAIDRFGDKSIEEYVIEPPNWALNGIGSALASLEKVNEIIPLDGMSELLTEVCHSLERKMFLFDCPDKPGSRVQLAMSYPIGLELINHNEINLAKKIKVIIDSIKIVYPSGAIKELKLKENFSKAIRLGYVDDTYNEKITINNDNAFFDVILDGNRNPYNTNDSVVHKIILNCESNYNGEINFFVKFGFGKVSLGNVPLESGMNRCELVFDPDEVFDSGIGRIARYDETYHETNFIWMNNISMAGTLPHSRHVMRRWLFSKLTGMGRPQLKFDDDIIRALENKREQLKNLDTSTYETQKVLIGELLCHEENSVAQRIEVVLPHVLDLQRSNKIHILGIGFTGEETVKIIINGEADFCYEDINYAIISRDEITVDINLQSLNCCSFELTVLDINDNAIGSSKHEIV